MFMQKLKMFQQMLDLHSGKWKKRKKKEWKANGWKTWFYRAHNTSNWRESTDGSIKKRDVSDEVYSTHNCMQLKNGLIDIKNLIK